MFTSAFQKFILKCAKNLKRNSCFSKSFNQILLAVIAITQGGRNRSVCTYYVLETRHHLMSPNDKRHCHFHFEKPTVQDWYRFGSQCYAERHKYLYIL